MMTGKSGGYSNKASMGDMAGEMSDYSKKTTLSDDEEEKKKKRKKAVLDSLSAATKGWGDVFTSNDDDDYGTYKPYEFPLKTGR